MEKSYRYPRSRDAIGSFRDALRHYVLPEYLPSSPPFSMSSTAVTLGSCFAENVGTAMAKAGANVKHVQLSENFNSPWANRVYLDYALLQKPIESSNHQGINPAALAELNALFRRSDVFIFTVGVAWCTCDDDGELLFDFVPGHGTNRLTTIEENKAHIGGIIKAARCVNPTIKIVLTVSPIPISRSLAASPKSAFVADCLSKSTLRMAVHEVMNLCIPDVYYWPSFEAIRWLAPHLGQVFGSEGEDHRHIGQSYIDAIVGEFVSAFFSSPTHFSAPS